MALSVNTRIIIIMHLHMNTIIQKIMICSCYSIIESILWELLNLDGALRHSALPHALLGLRPHPIS